MLNLGKLKLLEETYQVTKYFERQNLTIAKVIKHRDQIKGSKIKYVSRDVLRELTEWL